MSNPSLREFQRDFAGALNHHADAADSQPAFAVYRNTVTKAGIDALEANFPSVVRLVGRDWFRSAAALHVAAQPPADARLLMYGASFIDFLRDFEPARQLPYLPGVARLDRCWTESHIAADAPVLGPRQLAQMPPAQLASCRLRPHPAARWAWFDDAPIFTIWSRNRQPGEVEGEIAWQPEGALLTRAEWAVTWQAAGRADCAFLDACAQGLPLAEAAGHAAAADKQADLSSMLARLMQAGALADPTHDAPTSERPTP